MNKTLLILMVVIAALPACKKNYVCNCTSHFTTTSSNLISKDSSYLIEAGFLSEKKAKEFCNKNNYSYTGNGNHGYPPYPIAGNYTYWYNNTCTVE